MQMLYSTEGRKETVQCENSKENTVLLLLSSSSLQILPMAAWNVKLKW